MLNLFALFYLQKRSLIFNREGFWISFVHMTLPLFFSISVAYILVQAKLESYFCFLRGLLNLTDRNRAWDNIPKNEREKGILPVIVSQNKTLSLEKGVTLETLETSPPDALWLAAQPDRGPAMFAERPFVVLSS